jgi:outer membrane protein assembly factor BamB
MNARRQLGNLLPRWGMPLFLGVGIVFGCAGADWPQYRGANHDGISTDRINTQWSGSVTNPVWMVAFTNGLSSLAVSGGRVFTQVWRTTNGAAREVCLALSVTDGTELWATDVDDAYYPNGGVGYDDGPRTTPSVEGGSVFVLSSYLKLYRLNATNGAVIWQKDLTNLFGGTVIAWQNAASPLLDNGLIFVNANCGTSTLMALRAGDGSLAWRSQNERMTHSTPVVATIQGVRQVIFATQSGLVSVDPLSGSLLWRFKYPFVYSTALAVSPVVYQDMVFVCGAHAYNMGSVVMQASLSNGAWTTAQLWWTNNPASHWMTPVCHQGFLYGQFGIQTYDSVKAQLKCIDMRSGAVKWSTNGFGRGATILVNEHLLSITENGQLVLVQPNTNAYSEVARFLAIPNYNDCTNKCWNTPAVCNGRVYVRSTACGACFDFSMPDLKLDPPQPLAAGELRLTVRTVNGAPVDSNRLAGIEVRASAEIVQALTQWTQLTNRLVLTDGVVRIDSVNSGTQPRKFFIVSEPK